MHLSLRAMASGAVAAALLASLPTHGQTAPSAPAAPAVPPLAEVPPPPFVTVRLTDGQVLRGRIKVDVGLAFGSGSSVPLPWLDLTYNLR